MRLRSLRNSAGLLVVLCAVSCERGRRGTGVAPGTAAPVSSSAQPGAPDAASRPSAAPATPPPAPSPSSAVHCLSHAELARDMGLSFLLGGELSVVKVAPDDVLWLRERAGAGEKQVGKLAHDARGVRPTGGVCKAGGSTWFEVAAGNVRGWANRSFLYPTTEPTDATPRFTKLLGGVSFPTAEALVQAIRRALESERQEPSEGRFEVRLLGISRAPPRVAVLYTCCFADDSVAGEQVWLDLSEGSGQVTLRRARVSSLCARGVSGKLCR